MTIYFYKQNEIPYGCFSNFHKGHPIEIEGETWLTVEHYYQAMKFPDHPRIQEDIRQTEWAGHVWQIGNENNEHFDTEKWETIKDKVMLRGLRAKFSQHESLGSILLQTGEETIIEHTHNDSYWADGGDGSGLNRLGQLLMQVRAEIRG